MFIRGQKSLENQIIKVIDQQCKEEGECIIDLTELTDFQWDTVSIFIAGGNWLDIAKALNISSNIELADGIVFSKNGNVVKISMSSYDFLKDQQPRLTYWVEREPDDPFFKSYSYVDSQLCAKKIKLSNGGYRYVILG